MTASFVILSVGVSQRRNILIIVISSTVVKYFTFRHSEFIEESLYSVIPNVVEESNTYVHKIRVRYIKTIQKPLTCKSLVFY